MKPIVVPELSTLVAGYQNTAEHNDAVHSLMTAATWGDLVLTRHRRHVERHQLGFGDPAFHSMWTSLLNCAAARFGTVNALEIGVFKGQVISLWALIAEANRLDVHVSALGPLCGQPLPKSALLNKFRYRIDRRFREQIDNGNFYPDEDYAAIISAQFDFHGLDFDQVKVYHGFSTDAALLAQLDQQSFQLIYVDGDHSHAGALHDFQTFAPKIPIGGWLVADDASCDLPGTGFWKGHEAVSRAVQIMPSLGFKNVLNVGHNRIFERVG